MIYKNNFRLLFGLLFLGLAGCASDSNSSKVAALFFDYVRGANQKVPRERVAAIPYATMGLEYGFTPQVLLVLGSTTSEEQNWYAGEQLFVAMRRGRILRTAGLPYDLGGRHAVPFGDSASDAIAYTLDFPDLGAYGVAVLCTYADREADKIVILGSEIPTRHLVEHCSAPALKWTFDNEYWEGSNGYVWRSRQYVHPRSGPIVLEIFRPDESAAG